MSTARVVMAGLCLASLTAPAEAAPGPMATLKQKNSEVDRLLRLKTEPGSAEDKRRRDEVKALAATLFDYQELARRALGPHWTELHRNQQREFVSTLRELIEHNYVKQLRSNLDYQVEYRGEQLSGDEATVTTVVKVKTKGKQTDADIVYKLRRVGDRWLVYDVITDEVSLVRNYRSQFNKIITEKSYDELLRRMKAKLEEAG